MKTAMARELFSRDEVLARLADWEIFYAEVWGIDTNFARVSVPDQIDGFDRLIVRERSVTPESVLDKCQELMLVRSPLFSDLRRIISMRSDPADRAVWLRDRTEADAELCNLSSDDLKSKDIHSINFVERILYEMKYFLETGRHLDNHTITICFGSHLPHGYVPYVYWDRICLRIGCCLMSERSFRMRSRQVVG